MVLTNETRSAGGRAAAAKLTPEQRREKARAAVAARWAKRPKLARPIDDVLLDLYLWLDAQSDSFSTKRAVTAYFENKKKDGSLKAPK